VKENLEEKPLAMIVLRTILGFTPPEWAYLASQRTQVEINQGYARSLDRRIRKEPLAPLRKTERIEAMVRASCESDHGNRWDRDHGI